MTGKTIQHGANAASSSVARKQAGCPVRPVVAPRVSSHHETDRSVQQNALIANGRVLTAARSSESARFLRVVPQAVASAEETAIKSGTEQSTFTLINKSQIKVTVQQEADGSQTITLATDVQAARLLLHWGVEGGKNYKGGWRLPATCRPEGTIQYKDRALQSPFKGSPDGMKELVIALSPDEASDVLNFVLKDNATNTWYDNNGTNFAVSLRPGSAAKGKTALPKALCDKWAWVRWDHLGRPTRSEREATKDYDRAVAEMTELMSKVGRPLDELWKVADGKLKYSDYIAQHLAHKQQQQPAKQQQPAAASGKLPGPVPEDLVGVQAYVLWEKAGKPQGADFGTDARRVLEDLARSGQSYEEIAAKLNYKLKTPAQLQQHQQQQQAAAAAPQQAQQQQAPPPPPPQQQQQQQQPSQPLQVGQSLGVPQRNPLAMIKPPAPVLSAEKKERPEKPLDFLVQRFAVDPATKWRRLYALGGATKSELLVVVRNPAPAQAPRSLSLGNGGSLGDAAAASQEKDREGIVRMDIYTDLPNNVVLHWGVTKPGSREWLMPPEEIWPEDSKTAGHIALETAFLSCVDDECDVEVQGAKVPLQRISVEVPTDMEVGSLIFVVRSNDATMWYKDAGSNFTIPVPTKATEGAAAQGAQHKEQAVAQTGGASDELSKAIIDCEVNTHQWTLMHRFNKAAELINEVLNGYYEMSVSDAMARVFTWLRYSSTRQLTWQRNYNTQPRILSAAQERLTNTIAGAHARVHGEPQEWVRLMLTTVGRGGDGQRIRDEILHIMHRNHIPEKKGLWMEEWHQKLHNNTTPDDVPICEAYLVYLESNGNLQAYWRVLADAGITRERLEGFDRPITLEPQWFPEKKADLIKDFRNYLGILKSVHSGADLQASASAAGNRIPQGTRGYLAYVLGHLGHNQVLPLMEAAVEARTELAPSLPGNRELLYLDLALEDQVRQAAERGVGSAGFGAAAMMKPLLQNLCLSLGDNEEICYCLKTWQELPASVRSGGRPTKEEALQAVAVVNRIRRAISEVSDNVVKRIGGISKAYGQAFGVAPWAYELFAEEVVRGGPAFAVSLVISAIEPVLRNAAALGAWQVISPQQVTGVVEVVDGLHGVQDKEYAVPTVLVALQVTGEEEIPDGVVGVLTPDAPDVLSHVSVRARNMHVLFATCHDKEPLDQIKASKGKMLHFTTQASGSVTWAEVKADQQQASSDKQAAHSGKPKGLKIEVPVWCGKWAVHMHEYRDGVCGAKSKNLAKLQGKLPEHIRLPASVTLPFGCFEKVLEEPENKSIRTRLAELVHKLVAPKAEHQAGGPSSAADILAECRQLAMQVTVPKVVRQDLSAAMKDAGLPLPENEERWGQALQALKGVWASKYNDRAFYSMRKVGLNFDDVRMAVLVQRVVPAQYAFVIHTKNPSNNDEAEVFCELVRGLGESLVSGMVAGSAVAFKANKARLDHPEVLCYASKSEGMFVRESLIFRSDSNGEDLEGYAGAGLYESITMDPTETKRIDYMDDRLVKDPSYRTKLLSQICKVGASIETALGTAQDIEGVVAPDGSITVVQTRPQV